MHHVRSFFLFCVGILFLFVFLLRWKGDQRDRSTCPAVRVSLSPNIMMRPTSKSAGRNLRFFFFFFFFFGGRFLSIFFLARADVSMVGIGVVELDARIVVEVVG